MTDFLIPERHKCKTESELEAAAVMALFSIKSITHDAENLQIRPMRFESAIVQNSDVAPEPDRLSSIQCELDQLVSERAALIQKIAALQSASNDLPLWFECGQTPKAPPGQPGYEEAFLCWKSMQQTIWSILEEQSHENMDFAKNSAQGKFLQVRHTKDSASVSKCAGGFCYRLQTKDGRKAYHLDSIVQHTCLNEKRCKQ